MKSFWQKYKEGIVIFIYLVMIAALIYFGIVFFMRKIDEKRNKIEEEKLSQEVRSKKLKSIPQLKEQVEKISMEKEAFDVLLDKNNAVGLIEMLENIAQQEGVEIDISVNQVQQPQKAKKNSNSSSEDVNSGDDSKKDGGTKKQKILADDLPQMEYLSLSINCHGKFGNAFAFIRRLENLRYSNDIVSFQMKQAEKEEVSLTQSRDLFSTKQESPIGQVNNAEDGMLDAVITTFFYYKK